MSKTYNLAFCAVVFLDHLHVGVFGETVFADGWEVGGLPTGAVEVVLDLWCRHDVCGEQDEISEKMILRWPCGGVAVCGWHCT